MTENFYVDEVYVFKNGVTLQSAGQITTSVTTESTNTLTGALICAGGAGIGKNLNVAGISKLSGRVQLPVYTSTEMNALATPVVGEIIFNSTAAKLYIYNGAWKEVTSA